MNWRGKCSRILQPPCIKFYKSKFVEKLQETCNSNCMNVMVILICVLLCEKNSTLKREKTKLIKSFAKLVSALPHSEKLLSLIDLKPKSKTLPKTTSWYKCSLSVSSALTLVPCVSGASKEVLASGFWQKNLNIAWRIPLGKWRVIKFHVNY